MDSAVGEILKKSLVGGQMKELVDPYLLFSFAGKEVSLKPIYRVNTTNGAPLVNIVGLK